MKFRLKEAPAGYEEGVRELLEERGHRLLGTGEDGGRELVVELCLRESPEKKVRVSYCGARQENGEKTGSGELISCHKTFLFRALMLLLQRLEASEESFTLEEEVWLDRDGVMLDCSRNSVLRPEMIRRYIRLLASLGMNTLMLYTEDTYEVPEYPYFGAFRGRFTKQELHGLACYADQFGIEMVPCIQALAHLKNTLRWKAMGKMQDTDDILMVGEEEVYRFVEACIRNASEPFLTKRIHLGMDEAWSLGLGNYLHKNGYHSKAEIMSAHLERVAEICRKLGLSPMIWSDMYLRMSSPDNDYYDVPLDSDLSQAVKPPENVTLIYWDYYHTDRSFYEAYLRMHRQLSDKVIFAGGGWVWNGVSPNLKGARQTMEAGLNACKISGVREAFCTMWQDDGAETPMGAGLVSIVRFAEHGFARYVSEEELKARFAFLTGVEYDTFMILEEFDGVPGGEFYDNPSKYLLYQDALLGLFDAQMKGWDVRGYYDGLRSRLAAAKKPQDKEEGHAGWLGTYAGKILELYQALAEALMVKGPLGCALSAAYEQKDKKELERLASEEIPACMEKIRTYLDCREALWNVESGIFGFEVLDIRLGGLLARLERAGKRVRAYVSGGIDSLPELEEPRVAFLPAEGTEEGWEKHPARPVCSCNSWQTIVSASPI